MTKIMASTSPPSHSGSIRRRLTGNGKETTSEEQALNTIAKEAEARLAAKRAARAEARSIRMKEIEKRQKEAGDEGALSGSDADPLKENRYPLTRAATVSGDEHVTNANTQANSYDVLDNVSNDKQIVQLKETIKLNDVKYKKAMVNTAQLDNERQALQYQVETLKDIIEELQQRVENTDEELLHKTRDYNKLTREHNNTSAELNKSLFVIEERERILDEHGINIDGTMKEGYSSESSSTTTRCSSCSALLNDDIDTIDNPRGRLSLMEEISFLKSEVENLKQTSRNQGTPENTGETSYNELYTTNASNRCDLNALNSFTIPSLKMSAETTTPLEVDTHFIEVNKYNYNDVNDMSSLKIKIDSYSDAESAPSISPSGSVTPTSNININNYLGGEDNDDSLNDDGEHRTAFRLSRYFSLEPVGSSTGINTCNDNHEKDISTDTITNVEPYIDSYMNTDVPCMGIEDVQPPPKLAVEEMVTIDNIPLEMSSSDDFLESSDVVDPEFRTEDQKLNRISRNASRTMSRNLSTDSEVSLYYQILPGEENSLSNMSPDSSMNTAFCVESGDVNTTFCDEEEVDTNTTGENLESNRELLPQNASLTQIIRNDVEQLYNQIANETNDSAQTADDNAVDVENFNPALPFSPGGAPSGSEHKGWKVWLETSLVPKNKHPEVNKVAATESVDSSEPEPEPKERKKKKKKKKK